MPRIHKTGKGYTINATETLLLVNSEVLLAKMLECLREQSENHG